VTPESRNVANGAGGRNLAVTTMLPDAPWMATFDEDWLVVTGGRSATGQAVVTYRVEEDVWQISRSGTITVEELSGLTSPALHHVTQPAVPHCHGGPEQDNC
jgi:hypothetical protein